MLSINNKKLVEHKQLMGICGGGGVLPSALKQTFGRLLNERFALFN
jgi:hypothetical protein